LYSEWFGREIKEQEIHPAPIPGHASTPVQSYQSSREGYHTEKDIDQ